MPSVDALRRELARELRARGKPGGDPKLQKYVGSPVPALGLSTPAMREVMIGFVRAHPDLDAGTVNALADSLWRGGTLEERWAGISVLNRYSGVWNEASWKMAGRWVDDAVGWGLCDSLGSGPIAEMVYAKPARFRDLLRWTRSGNFWRRRASTYALDRFVRAGELGKPLELLERLLYDPEFWVQRAVGTWLRECWKKDERRVRAYLLSYAPGLPPVTVTVATERAPKAFREELRRLSKAAPAHR